MSQSLAYNNVSVSPEPFMPDQSYVSLFQPSTDVRPYNLDLGYWQSEVKLILSAYDVKAIQRVIRYNLFNHGDLIRNVLRNRNKDTVKGFLGDIVAPEERVFTAELTQDELVEKIIRLSQTTSARYFTWEWLPSLQGFDSGPQAIAAEIDAESHRQFSSIPFEEWVRYSLGYSVTSVEWFLHQHTNFNKLLSNYLNKFPDEIKKYREVAEVRRKISV